eukprot:3833084-Rhodomonas_salina.2
MLINLKPQHGSLHAAKARHRARPMHITSHRPSPMPINSHRASRGGDGGGRGRPAEAKLAVLGLGEPVQAVHLVQFRDRERFLGSVVLDVGGVFEQPVQQILLLHRRPLGPQLLGVLPHTHPRLSSVDQQGRPAPTSHLGLSADVEERDVWLEVEPGVSDALGECADGLVELRDVRGHALGVEPRVPVEARDLVLELRDRKLLEVLRRDQLRLELLDVRLHERQKRLPACQRARQHGSCSHAWRRANTERPSRLRRKARTQIRE